MKTLFSTLFSRRKLLVNPKGQILLLGMVGGFTILIQVLFFLFEISLLKAQGNWIGSLAVFSGVAICVIAGLYLFLLISNRFFGPIYRLKNHMMDAIQSGGPYKKIEFRKDDGLSDIAETYNKLIEKINETGQSQIVPSSVNVMETQELNQTKSQVVAGQSKSERGFTMIELVVVLGITSVLLSFGFYFSSGTEDSVQLRLETSKIVQALYKSRSIAKSSGLCVSVLFNERDIEVRTFRQASCAVINTAPLQTQTIGRLSSGVTTNIPSSRNPLIFNSSGSTVYSDITEVIVTKDGRSRTISVFPKTGLIRSDRVIEVASVTLPSLFLGSVINRNPKELRVKYV